MSSPLVVAPLKQDLKRFAVPDTNSSMPPGAVAPSPAEGMTIAESFLLKRLRDFADFTYTKSDAHYPWPLPGVKVPTQKRQNNCCTFVEALVVKAWEDAVGERLQWNLMRHQQMMINGPGNDIYSPVTALVEAGIAVRVESSRKAPPPPWTVIQGWRSQSPLSGGHTFILVGHRNGKVLTLESNESFGLKGVGFRGLGHAERFGFSPPPRWWEKAEVWDWEKLRTTYPHHQLARLKVDSLQWPV
jgi:hypothetical protein